MKMIIDIPDGMLEAIKDGYWSGSHKLELAIRNGIPYEEKTQGDLISREALQEEHSKECVHNCYYCQHFKWSKKKACSYCDVIDNAPTVEYPFYQEAYQSGYEEGKNERPKGEWIIIKDEKWGDNVKCPFCGKELAGTDLNFCCKCGAKLTGSEKMNGGAE